MKGYKLGEEISIMDTCTCSSPGISELFESVETIQVLYFLEKYNPNVTLDRLSTELGIGDRVIVEVIKNLIKFDLITFRKDEDQYSLTSYGRNIVKTLHQIIS